MTKNSFEQKVLEYLIKETTEKKLFRISFLDVLLNFDDYKVSEIEGAVNALLLSEVITVFTKDLRPFEIEVHLVFSK